MRDQPKDGRSADIVIDEAFSAALDLLEKTQKNIFISGKAGTGKSTLLKCFRERTKKDVVVLSPTGVSALNVQGQTIHSFFQFRPDITPEKVHQIRMRKERRRIYEAIQTLVIDEISMVRADLLDCIDAFLRLYGPYKDFPFGGVQMVFFGDLYQLPPVVTYLERDIFSDRNTSLPAGPYESPFFFDAKSFKVIRWEYLELQKIYRQKDPDFIGLLGRIRDNSATSADFNMLNRAQTSRSPSEASDFYIYLTTTNEIANRINDEQLRALKTRPYHYDAILEGDFEAKNLPTQASLDLKFDAQVMILNNDPQGRWVNGTIGRVAGVKELNGSSDIILVETEDSSIVEVSPFTWKMYRFYFDEDTQRIESEAVGSFTQYPLRLAWAMTIHKAQGKTFSRVILDVGDGTFSHGQLYVALSRCTNLEGIIVKRPILRRHVIVDERVNNFFKNKFQENFTQVGA